MKNRNLFEWIRSHQNPAEVIPLLLGHLESLATIDDDALQKRFLKELIRNYVVLEKRVDSLLKNTLPVSVAEELKEKGEFPPRAYTCTILFTDFMRFTQLAEVIPGTILVETLNAIFTRKMISEKQYDRPIQIAEGIYWVGYRDGKSDLTCNPYLVVQGNQAVLIDSGSRTDFAAVMMKILQTGIDPQKIVALIYQHYDPDLCGSMSNFIDMCDNPYLKVISERGSNVFISYYIPRDRYHLLDSIDDRQYAFSANGRVLEFIPTPYSHSPGSFVTYDRKTRTLFSSDLFGSHSTTCDLFLELEKECFHCTDYDNCPKKKVVCPIKDILSFHEEMMPCTKALRYAIGKIKGIPIERIAPQHGNILHVKEDIDFVVHKLETMENVGIDAIA